MKDGYGVVVWKAFRNEREVIKNKPRFSIGNGRRVKFYKDLWCKNLILEGVFLNFSPLLLTKMDG